MKEETEIVFVVDQSTSMGIIRAEAISGFNKFLEEQKKVPGAAKVTLALFDTSYKLVHNALPIQDVPPLTPDTYWPQGMTALLDAIGRTIDSVGARLAALPESERPNKVLFVILTDGQENCSHEYKTPDPLKVSKMIKKQREEFNWGFIFLQANEDAFDVAKNLNIGANNAMYFANTRGSVGQTMSNVSASATRFRSKSIGTYNSSTDSLLDDNERDTRDAK